MVAPSPAPSTPATTPPTATTQPATSHVEFDVATVKPAAPLDLQRMAADIQAGKMPRLGPHVDASRAEFTYMSLKDLIVYAYIVKPYQVDGPSWLADQRFDIEAKMPDGAPKDQAPAMMQALLAERFKLTVHRDHEEHKVLALVVGKGGPKLKESPAPPPPADADAPAKPGETKIDTEDGPMKITRNTDGSVKIDMGARGTMTEKLDMSTQSLHIESSMVTMDGFADMLTNMMQMGGSGGPQVVNMTGLKDNYQVTLDLSLADLMAMARASGMNLPGGTGGAGAQADSPANAASDPQGGGQGVYSSVEQMGLKLEERKATVERLVVDHAEKSPSAD
ncbi:MAG: TIGR03435 family protein [Terracidiphilus sp.]